ncbi:MULTISPECIES: hypothetical protein [unclassified Gordonia (in: high G+C Gram-positive bacteria)]|uniref:hypothetical protein n=1 Tax=unclassified Gordonia (in: high G+C Gram-positive bacteria) TaxID=2657482 RepID=UPI001F0E017D|nr:hypothetical protein [Gordonia sp. ABSL49_1]MCH5642255.1 hypothetical protein [Gordonia sp. ABSL49_1]
MALLVIVTIALLALAGWSMSVRRAGAPRRDPQYFLLSALVNDGASSGTDWRAELIEEKHRLEWRAALPALVVGATATAGALYIVLGSLQPTEIPELRWITAELALVALASIVVAAGCIRHAASVAVRGSRFSA